MGCHRLWRQQDFMYLKKKKGIFNPSCHKQTHPTVTPPQVWAPQVRVGGPLLVLWELPLLLFQPWNTTGRRAITATAAWLLRQQGHMAANHQGNTHTHTHFTTWWSYLTRGGGKKMRDRLIKGMMRDAVCWDKCHTKQCPPVDMQPRAEMLRKSNEVLCSRCALSPIWYWIRHDSSIFWIVWILCVSTQDLCLHCQLQSVYSSLF